MNRWNPEFAVAISKLALERSRLLAEEADLWRQFAALVGNALVDEPEPRPVPPPVSCETPVEPKDEYLMPAEAGKFLRLAPATLAKLRCIGGGPQFVKSGGRILYRREDLVRFLSERSYPHTSAYQSGTARQARNAKKK